MEHSQRSRKRLKRQCLCKSHTLIEDAVGGDLAYPTYQARSPHARGGTAASFTASAYGDIYYTLTRLKPSGPFVEVQD